MEKRAGDLAGMGVRGILQLSGPAAGATRDPPGSPRAAPRPCRAWSSNCPSRARGARAKGRATEVEAVKVWATGKGV